MFLQPHLNSVNLKVNPPNQNADVMKNDQNFDKHENNNHVSIMDGRNLINTKKATIQIKYF